MVLHKYNFCESQVVMLRKVQILSVNYCKPCATS